MSRWKYRTETVTVGDNSQTVRQLTSGELRQVLDLRTKVMGDGGNPMDLVALVVRLGATNPGLSETDVAEMPQDLQNACREKIMDLSGMGDEKKEPTTNSPNENSPSAALPGSLESPLTK